MEKIMKYMTPIGKFDFNNATSEDFIYAFENLSLFSQNKELAQKTVDSYKKDLDEFLSYLKRENVDLKQVNVWTLQGYASMLNKKFAERSAKRKISLLKRLLRYGHKNNFYTYELESEIETPKISKFHISKDGSGHSEVREMDLTTANLIIEGLTKIVKTNRPIANIIKLRNRIIGTFLLSTGMRASEVISLKWTNIHKTMGSDEYAVTFLGKGSKSRTIPLQIGLMDMLFELRKMSEYKMEFKDDERAIFVNYNEYNSESPKAITYVYLHKLVQTAVAHVIKEITPINGGITPHWFRHTFITTALEQDTPLVMVKELAGHSSISTTNLYIERISEKALQKEVKKLEFGIKSEKY